MPRHRLTDQERHRITPAASYRPVDPLTPELARAFAVLVQAGVPPADACAKVSPMPLGPERRKTLAKAWLNSTLVLNAVALLNAAPDWSSLDADARLAIARDKHLAELAYFLYTHAYPDMTDLQRDEARYAAKMLMDYLGERTTQTEDPFTKALREMAQERAESHVRNEAETLANQVLDLPPAKAN